MLEAICGGAWTVLVAYLGWKAGMVQAYNSKHGVNPVDMSLTDVTGKVTNEEEKPMDEFQPLARG